MLTSWLDYLPAWLTKILFLALLATGVLLWFRGLAHTRRSERRRGQPDQSTWMIRGIRSWILAVGCWFFAAGVETRDGRWIAFGLVFLAEEVFETGIMLLAARSGEKRSG